jgi:hypothetical protein
MARFKIDFEIAPVKYWITVPLDDIRLYLLVLNIDGKTGWRVPFSSELKILRELRIGVDEIAWSCQSCALSTKSEVPFLLIPVRDKNEY